VNKILFFITICFLTSCGTTTHLKILRNGGVFKEEISSEAGYDYKVFIRNASDFGWNGDEKEDREKAVNFMFADRCKKVEILEELPLQTGTYPINKPAITWIMKIKCGK
jgi:hypothetical protein